MLTLLAYVPSNSSSSSVSQRRLIPDNISRSERLLFLQRYTSLTTFKERRFSIVCCATSASNLRCFNRSLLSLYGWVKSVTTLLEATHDTASEAPFHSLKYFASQPAVGRKGSRRAIRLL